MAKILIVEDDKLINRLLRKNLELAGHYCQSVFDGEAVFDKLETEEFDLMLLDIMLPKLDGFGVLADLQNYLPVIILSAKGAVHDRVKGLNLGADDYLVKPFEMEELIARVESLLRRTKTQSEVLQLGDVSIDMSARLVYREGKLIELTPQEFSLIEVLMRNRNIAMSRDRLLETAWGHDYEGDTRTVDVHISMIRKKLGWENVVKTVYKIGYRLEITL